MVAILQKGENISLSHLIPNLNELMVAVKWAKKANDETEIDVNASAFLLTEHNKVRTDADFIFHKQTTAPNNAIVFKINNNKDSLFKTTLSAITNDVHKISFALTLNNSKQHFGLLEKITIELFNFSDKQKLISYSVEHINTETAIILGVLYRYNTEWRFRAMGQGYNNGLAVLAKKFGVNIEEPAEQQTQTSPIADNTANKPTQVENKTTPIINNQKDNKDVKNNSQKPKPKPKNKKSNNNPPAQQKTPDLDIHNTDMMTKIDHYAPIVAWLQRKNIQAEVNESAMDTSGFFDEIALELGDNYELLKRVSDTVKRRQQGKYDKAYIDLSRDNPETIKSVQKFCQQLYDYAFAAKYFYINKDKKAVLHLQAATKIINFFNGEWLEWYAVMKIAELCHERKIDFSCTRNMKINLPNDNSRYEVDVFFLIDNLPLFIECKSGEYREFIDKYTRLRKKLAIPKPYFLMLVLGMNDEQAKGLTAMFDITFVNEKMLLDYIIEFFVKKKPITIENNTESTKTKPTSSKKPELEPSKTKKNNNAYFIIFIGIMLLIVFLYYR
jgi:stress response protein SCP2